MTHTNPSRRARALFKAIRKLDRKRRREADRAAFLAGHGREPTLWDREHMRMMRQPRYAQAYRRCDRLIRKIEGMQSLRSDTAAVWSASGPVSM